MFLDLNVTPTRTRELVATQVRELTQADLALTKLDLGTKAPPRKKLSERHHALARILASGSSPAAAAVLTGYQLATVSTLQVDPSFKELMSFYRSNVDAQYVALHDIMAGLSKDAALVLRERLEEDPDQVSTQHIVEILKTTADRTGHGPKSTQDVNVNVSLANRLEEARRRVAARVIDALPSDMVDITPTEVEK